MTRFLILLIFHISYSGCLSSSINLSKDRLHNQRITVDFNGNQIANELQLINHLNINTKESSDYAITSAFPLIISNNDDVIVSYTSLNPNEDDWIGFYSPADVDITKNVPIKYAFCKGDISYIKTGKGNLVFNLTNLREDVSIHYFTGALLNPLLVATYEKKVSFLSKNEPLRPRIVSTGMYVCV
jgi:hypothetical protein